jgi:hypothetical protein
MVHRVFCVCFILLSACGGGTETRLASAETSVKAEIVRKSGRVFTDRGWRTQTADSVIVRRFIPVEFGTVCIPGKHDYPELSLDARAERAAYRCAKDEPWHVHYLKSSDSRTFQLCSPLKELSWKNVALFEEARVGFLSCGSAAAGESFNSFKDIFEESQKRNGDQDAARFLLETASTEFSTPYSHDSGDDWTRAYRALSSAAREKLDAQMLEVLPDRLASDLFVHRALLAISPEKLRGHEASLLKIAGIAARNTDASDTSFQVRWRTLDIALRILAQNRRKDAADLACKAASSFAANGKSRILPRIQLALIADAGISCNLDGVFDRSVCGVTYACCARGFTCADASRRKCTSKELDALLALELSRDPQNPWPPGSTSGDELLVAAAHKQASQSALKFLQRIEKAPACL